MTEILTNLLGYGVTILAAFIGFGGVIYSQRALMRQSEIGRLHQEKVERARVEEAERKAKISFMNAVLGELAALEVSIGKALKLLGAQINIAQELSAQSPGSRTQPRLAFRFMTPVIDSHISKIGLLDPDLAFRLSNVYGHILSLGAQTQEQVPQVEAASAVKIMKSVEDNLRALISDVAELRLRMNATVVGP